MPVKYIKWLDRKFIQANPEARFVFGDNVKRQGLGGQAKEARGEPNAIGVATRYAPGVFYQADDPRVLHVVASDLERVAFALRWERTVYVPLNGLGTGLARLPEHAPALHRLIVAFFHAAPGEPCPWPMPEVKP